MLKFSKIPKTTLWHFLTIGKKVYFDAMKGKRNINIAGHSKIWITPEGELLSTPSGRDTSLEESYKNMMII